MKNKNIKQLCIGGLMAALITVSTAFIKIPNGITGYIHFGDAMVYLAGCILGPWAALVCAVGGGLADLLAGYPQWVPFTAVIKAVNTVPFLIMSDIYRKRRGRQKILSSFTAPMVIVSGIWTVAGYFISNVLLYSLPTAVSAMPFDAIQAVGSGIIFIIIGILLNRVNISKYI